MPRELVILVDGEPYVQKRYTDNVFELAKLMANVINAICISTDDPKVVKAVELYDDVIADVMKETILQRVVANSQRGEPREVKVIAPGIVNLGYE